MIVPKPLRLRYLAKRSKEYLKIHYLTFIHTKKVPITILGIIGTREINFEKRF